MANTSVSAANCYVQHEWANHVRHRACINSEATRLTWAGKLITCVITIYVTITDPVTRDTRAHVIVTPVIIARTDTVSASSCSRRGFPAWNPPRWRHCMPWWRYIVCWRNQAYKNRTISHQKDVYHTWVIKQSLWYLFELHNKIVYSRNTESG